MIHDIRGQPENDHTQGGLDFVPDGFTTPEHPSETPQEQLGRELTELYNKSRYTTQRALAVDAYYGLPTINTALKGRRKPARKLITAIVRTCINNTDNPAEDVDIVIARLHALRDRIGPQIEAVEEHPPEPVENPEPNSSDGKSGSDNDGETVNGHKSSRWNSTKELVRRHPRRACLLAAVAVAALAAGGYLYAASGCGIGPAQVDGECIGLSDGSTPLLADEPADLTRVRELIRLENEFATRGDAPWVSVAYTFPLAATDAPKMSQTLPIPALIHELEGAYIAQREANHTGSFDTGARVQLLLGNEGRDATEYAGVVDDVRSIAPAREDLATPDTGGHLVAVAATGKSLDTVRRAIDDLTGMGLPVITSRLTSDKIVGAINSERTVIRTAPAGEDQLRPMTGLVRPGPAGAALVASTDPSDIYSSSLSAAFTTIFPGTIAHPDQPYTYNPGATDKTMSTVVANICNDNLSTVFFAGRSDVLIAFVQALANRPSRCKDTFITVVTGSDAVDFANAAATGDPLLRNALNAGLDARTTVYYSATATPLTWDPPDPNFNSGTYTQLKNDFTGVFPLAHLDDGAGILGHDVVQTIISTVRFNDQNNNTPSALAGALRQRVGLSAIPLASGWLSVGRQGEAVNKAVPIVRVEADGKLSLAVTPVGGARGAPCIDGDRTRC